MKNETVTSLGKLDLSVALHFRSSKVRKETLRTTAVWSMSQHVLSNTMQGGCKQSLIRDGHVQVRVCRETDVCLSKVQGGGRTDCLTLLSVHVKALLRPNHCLDQMGGQRSLRIVVHSLTAKNPTPVTHFHRFSIDP